MSNGSEVFKSQAAARRSAKLRDISKSIQSLDDAAITGLVLGIIIFLPKRHQDLIREALALATQGGPQ